MRKIGWWDWCVRGVCDGAEGTGGSRRRDDRIFSGRLMTGAAIALMLMCGSMAEAQSTAPQFKDFDSYVQWVRKNHKAPFHVNWVPRRQVPQGAVGGGASGTAAEGDAKAANPMSPMPALPALRPFPGVERKNVKVNQDRNPYSKLTIAAAVDPTDGNNVVVLNDDFRQINERIFYHVSSDGGRTWSDDYLTDGADPLNGGAPPAFQRSPGISFDLKGNTYMTHVGGNEILIFATPDIGYMNFDTEIDVIQGFGHGTYLAQTPIVLNTRQCGGLFGAEVGTFDCEMALDDPHVTTDDNPNSPNNGKTYVYYTLFCNATPSVCTDGDVSLPGNSSVIVEQDNEGNDSKAYSSPKLVGGTRTASNFSHMVIDASGTAHIFFADFNPGDRGGVVPSNELLFESTLTNGTWVVSEQPVAQLNLSAGTGNANWGFGDESVAPDCSIHVNTAYCAFTVPSVNNTPEEPTPQVYLAIIDTKTAQATFTRVNNDPIGNTKHHLFAWATATPLGEVYVGWYDDKNDPTNQDVQYFVAKSTDGGKTFPVQGPVSELFNPCTGSPNCSNFGDYTQLVSGPDGVVHATWQDTRDGKASQIWSETVR